MQNNRMKYLLQRPKCDEERNNQAMEMAKAQDEDGFSAIIEWLKDPEIIDKEPLVLALSIYIEQDLDHLFNEDVADILRNIAGETNEAAHEAKMILDILL